LPQEILSEIGGGGAYIVLMSDAELLREYAVGNSEAAFAALVERHLNMVY
jgi:hypothetical protein